MVDRFALDQGALTTEMRLLLAFLRADSLDELAESKPELFAAVDWESFVRLGLHHRVYPYVYPKLSRMTGGPVPSGTVDRFKRDYRNNTVQMLHLSGEMGRLGEELARLNIRALFLKGPVIARDLYGDISLRTSMDLDVIVPISDLPGTEEMLARIGYEKDNYIETILSDWRWRHHHTTFFHAGKNIKVEVHWRLNPAPSKEPGFEELWERRRKSGLVNPPIYYLGREDLFLFLVSHGARHGWSRLRWLLDIKQLLMQRPDTATLVRLLRRYRQESVAGQAIILASELLEMPVDPGLRCLTDGRRPRRQARSAMFYVERMVNLHQPPLPADVSRHHRRYLPSLLTPGQKLLFLLTLLFPYAEDAKTLPLPKNLHFLYFPLRPFLWAWRKTVGVHR